VPFEETGAPPELERWSNWVLFGEEYHLCPPGPNGYSEQYCVLPVTLSIELTDTGGIFKGTWEVRGGKRSVRLPGDLKSWPRDVYEASGLFSDRVAVGVDAGGPAALLQEGSHEINGAWSWTQLPETVTVPLGPFPAVTVNGSPLEFPETDIDWGSRTARIWLRDPQAPAPSAAPGEEAPQAGHEWDSIDVRMARLVKDDQPLLVYSRARVTVSGEPREELIPGVLLPGGIPVSLQSPLPARLTGEGLRIQVRPGTYDVYIETRQTGEPLGGSAVGVPAGSPGGAGTEAPGGGDGSGPGAGSPSPYSVGGTERLGPVSGIFGQEYWAFQADPVLRQAEVEGALQIDASQADIPWTGLPVYALDEGDSLTVTTLRRGDPDPGPNLLTLSRKCWLDYSGGGLTCRDRLRGQMRRDWRLTADPPFEIGQATLNGEAQVITWQKNSKGEDAPGVQLRRGSVDLMADLRIPDFDGDFPAAGWDQGLSARTATLNLPPGWKLVNVSGADATGGDRLPASWRDRWTTLDLFIVLVIVFATWKLIGLPWAILGAAMLAVSYQEYLSPRLVYLHLLAAAAILKVLPPTGKARFVVSAWRTISAMFLVIACASFVILQARWAAYPQLEPTDFGWSSSWALGPSAPLYRGSGFPVPFGAASNRSMSFDEDFTTDEVTDGFSESGADKPMPMAVEMSAAPAAPSHEPTRKRQSFRDSRQIMAGAAGTLSVESPRQSIRMTTQNSMQAVQTDAKAQNSFPRPSWGWRTVSLDYNGQVAKDQKTGLVLAGPGVNRFLGVLRVILAVWFSLSMLGLRLPEGYPPRLSALFPPRRSPGGAQGSGTGSSGATGGSPAAALALALALPLASLCLPASAHAQSSASPFPPRELLEALESRLKDIPDSPAPGIPDVEIRPGEGTLALAIQVETSREAFVALPQLDPKIFQPVRATLDSKDMPLLVYDGELHMVLAPQGASTVLLEGRLQDTGAFQISFPRDSRPMRARLAAPGWELRGVNPQGQLTGNAVFLSRTAGKAPGGAPPETPGDPPPHVPGETGDGAAEGGSGDSPGAPAAGSPGGTAGEGADGAAEVSGGPQAVGGGTGETGESGGDAGESGESGGDAGESGEAGGESGEPGGVGGAETAEGDGPGGAAGSSGSAGPGTGNMAAGGAPSIVKPFFRLTRTVSLGQDLKVLTSVEPLAPLDAPFTLTVPLVPGEMPTASGLSVEDGKAHLALSPGAPSRSWESSLRLPEDGSLTLAAADGPWSEAWILDAATLWRVETDGLPPVLSISDSGFWNPEWRPAPGDTLKLTVTRPKPVEGRYLVADDVMLAVQAGREVTRANLALTIRSSQGGNHSFRLPAGAVTEELKLDGRPLPFGRPGPGGEGPTVTAPLNPGNHSLTVEFTLPSVAGMTSVTPEIDLGMPSANVATALELPPERWTFMVGGPVQGPAVLFWSHAGAFLIFAFFLSALKLTPLRTVSWLLFFIGISQLSVEASLVCCGWLLALGLRAGKFSDVRRPWRFNALQLLLVLWTAVALYLIYRGLTHGLLESPNMSVSGNGSSEHSLRWFQDRASGPFDRAWAVTLPGPLYRVLMLAWALWMAVSVVRWLRWGWKAFSTTALWKRSPRAPKPQRITPAQRMAMSRPHAYPPQRAPQGYPSPETPQGYPPQGVPQGYPSPEAPQGYPSPEAPQGYPSPEAPQRPGRERRPEGTASPGDPRNPEGAGGPGGSEAPEGPVEGSPAGGSGPEGKDPEKP
jgi:hypothetical protein